MDAGITALVVVGLTMTLVGLMFGVNIAESSYPDFRAVNFGACSGNALDLIGCWLANVGALVYNFFAFIIGTVAFMFNIMTFNIPGAPAWVRAMMTLLLGGPLLWLIGTKLFRGSGG